MKLIKLSKIHYVLTEKSEVKIGELCLDMETKEFYVSKGIVPPNPYVVKITHSTKPLEDIGLNTSMGIHLGFDKISPLSLSEVEDIINEYNVEEMAYKKVQQKFKMTHLPLEEISEYGGHIQGFASGYIEGFKSHQELVKDKFLLTKGQLINAILFGMEKGLSVGKVTETDGDWVNNYIKNIPTKTEWEVTFDERGKLKLV